jgi:hypothetical protein
MWKYITKIFILWRVNLEMWRWVGERMLSVREGYLGSTPWANFDGHHYIMIADRGYGNFDQAFFPLYPLLIRYLGGILNSNYTLAGLLISNISIFLGIIVLWYLLKKIKFNEENIKWSIIFFLFFPTSFYFAGVYTESLFILLIFLSFLALESNRWIIYFVGASLASLTRLVGAFLLAPIGLVGYMIYLAKTYGDPLLFIHVQPAFGANRSGGEVILLPQVFWRYLKIYTTVPVANYEFWIAVLEMAFLLGTLILLFIAWKKKVHIRWILFSLAATIAPTLTGTLSSIPRYVLVAFPIYIVLANIKRKPIRYLLLITCYLLQGVLIILFTRGYWVS